MAKDLLKVDSIGRVIIVQFDELKEWRLDYGYKTYKLGEDWKIDSFAKDYRGTELYSYFSNRFGGILEEFTPAFWESDDNKKWPEFEKSVNSKISNLKRDFNYSSKFNNPFQVYFSNENFTIIGFGETKMVLPTEFLVIELYKTYEDVLPYDIPKILGEEVKTSENGENLPVYLPDGAELKNLPKSKLKSGLEEVKASIQAQEEELKNGLEAIRAEMRKKEEELRLQMEEKMSELEAKKKEFEVQIFGIDHQLYLLRCLLGDSIEFIQLRKGKLALQEQPIILYQKLRFLDEDLAKIKSLYCYDYDDESYVEEIFAKDDFVFEQFCPNDKCVTLFRISKDNTFYAKGDGNALEKCKYYNGTRIGLLVRNGENLYLVWTEQSRIYLKENFIMGYSSPQEVTNETNLDRDEVITNGDYTNKRELAWVQYFSRKFLLTILQGLVEYKKVLQFPEKVNFLTGPSHYVIFSTADNQIADNRFGTLSDFMKSRNFITQEDDYILPTQSIAGSYSERGWGSYNTYYENHDRGRGYNNRVRGCSIPDEVVKVNLVEIPSHKTKLNSNTSYYDLDKKETVTRTFEEMTEEQKSEHLEYKKAEALLFDSSGNPVKDRVRIDNVVYSIIYKNAGKGYVWRDTGLKKKVVGIEKEIFFTDKVDEYKFYVSVEKPAEWNSKRKEDSIVNSRIRIYPDEFINLTYLSSSILTYFIETKQIGNYFGTNYAYAIKYLHKALKFIRDRENNDYIKISSQLRKDVSVLPGIDIILMDWKFNNRVREITDYQAKRFAKYFSEIANPEDKSREITQNLDWIKGDK